MKNKVKWQSKSCGLGDKVVIDYIESSPALLPLLIFLVFAHTHMHTQSERQRVRRSHQSGNNILLRRPFTAHSHKSPRQSHHPHCQRLIMRTRARAHAPGPCSSRQTFIQALSVAASRMSSNGRNMTPNPEPRHTSPALIPPWPCLKDVASPLPQRAALYPASKAGPRSHSSVTGRRGGGVGVWGGRGG